MTEQVDAAPSVAQPAPAVAGVTVVICAYTERRWNDLLASIDSLDVQTQVPDEVLVVVDHNDTLLLRVAEARPTVSALPSSGPRGLSGARNTGVLAARGDIVLFLDDDAVADPSWVAEMTVPFGDSRVQGVGGWAEPVWSEGRPRWFPQPFLWVVGCSYEGLPRVEGEVRNPLGCAMGFRRSVFDQVGGFSADVGRTAAVPAGCEETEFAIRVRQSDAAARIVHRPTAVVQHHVTPDRARPAYFFRRCWHEGRSKAVLSRELGSRDSLASEREYVRSVLPRAVLRGLGETLRTGRTAGAASSLAVLGGLVTTSAGYAHALLRRGSAPVAIQPRPELPMWCICFDLDAEPPLSLVAPGKHQSVRALVRLHGTPLGYVTAPLTNGAIGGRELAELAARQLSGRIDEHLTEDGILPVEGILPDHGLTPAGEGCESVARPGGRVSVVVCTRDRGPALRDALRPLRTLDHPDIEVIIVDNAPRDDATRSAFELEVGTDQRFRYLVEPRPGLSCARNRGLREVTGEIVAFTDDDVSVDPGWVSALARAFAEDDDVTCVTGMAATAGIDGPAELYFDARTSWSAAGRSRVWRLSTDGADGLFPYSPGIFGTGANMAFRTSSLRELGGFDEALGAGTATSGGEDLDIFVRVLLAGQGLRFQPAALVWHHHRADMDGLRRQMSAYGSGLTAFLAKHLADPATRYQVLRRVPRGLHRAALVPADTSRNVGSSEVEVSGLLARELAGALLGPVRYVRARREIPA